VVDFLVIKVIKSAFVGFVGVSEVRGLPEVPKTEVSWTIVVVQLVDRGECSFKSDEQDTDRRL